MSQLRWVGVVVWFSFRRLCLCRFSPLCCTRLSCPALHPPRLDAGGPRPDSCGDEGARPLLSVPPFAQPPPPLCTAPTPLRAQVVPGQTIVEVKPLGVSKGKVVERILHDAASGSEPPDFILCIGNDRSGAPYWG